MKSKFFFLFYIFPLAMPLILQATVPPQLPMPYGLILKPYDMTGVFYATDEVYKMLHDHDYDVDKDIIDNDPNPDLNPQFELDEILQKINEGFGVIYLITHGNSDQPGLLVEAYPHTQEGQTRRDQNYDLYVQTYGAGMVIKVERMAPQEQIYGIAITPLFIQTYIEDFWRTILFSAACYGDQLASTFTDKGCWNVFHYSGEPTSEQEARKAWDIFARMAGHQYCPHIQSVYTNKSAQVAYEESQGWDFQPLFHLVGPEPDEKIYNSPRIVGLSIKQGNRWVYLYKTTEYGGWMPYPYEWEYPGDLSGCPKNPAVVGNQPLEVKILFSAPMNPEAIQVQIKAEQGNFSIPVNGNWGNYVFNNDLWTGACDFSEWSGGENAIVSVDAEDAFEGDINAKLDINGDGNSDGTDTNHKFKVELPPQVIFTDPSQGEENVDIYDFRKQKEKGIGDEFNFEVVFNKPMDTVSVCQAIKVVNVDKDSSPVLIKNIYWYDDRTILVRKFDLSFINRKNNKGV